MEHRFDHYERSSHQGSSPADCSVSALLLDGKRMSANGPVHGPVHRCPRLHAEISPVPIDGLPFLQEIDPAVMEGGGGRCDHSGELMIPVLENMEFVPKIRSRPFFRPGTIAASPRFRLIPSGDIGRCMTGIRGDETRILDHASPDRQPFPVDLMLQLLPDVRSPFPF